MWLNIKPDDKGRIIIELYNTRTEISQSEIASQLHLSQPLTALRIKKLKEMGLIGKKGFKHIKISRKKEKDCGLYF